MKRIVLFFACALLGWSMAYAEEVENDAIYAWVEGSSTCYQLSAMPKVTYDEGAAVLSLNGAEELRLALTDGAQLKITFGVYQKTDFNEIPMSTVQQVGKYIIGGRLIIVRDGKQFDAQGKQIK